MFAASTLILSCAILSADIHPLAAPGVTSLTNSSVKYAEPSTDAFVLHRGSVRAVIVNNAAVDTNVLSGHRAGYNGVGSLTHDRQSRNLFVPFLAGLNFEHIHDGTLAVTKEKFEPRIASLQMRIINEHTVELYQPPTHNWKLESCGRYHMLADGTVEYTFECIPRADLFRNGYIGLFWASYIDEPDDKAIYFRGHDRGTEGPTRLIRAVTPSHGVDSTHAPAAFPGLPVLDPAFTLTLVNHPSRFVYDEPWYYGVSRSMALVQMFRQRDRIWLAQSPTGGGANNPAWDFQWFVPNAKVNEAYGFVMRASYLPFESHEQIEVATREHRKALNP